MTGWDVFIALNHMTMEELNHPVVFNDGELSGKVEVKIISFNKDNKEILITS